MKFRLIFDMLKIVEIQRASKSLGIILSGPGNLKYIVNFSYVIGWLVQYFCTSFKPKERKCDKIPSVEKFYRLRSQLALFFFSFIKS